MAIRIKIVADYDKKGMTEANKALDNFAKGAQVALGAVAVATAALAVKSVQEFAKFDDALNQSLAIMGNVSDQMKGEMADAARQMAKVTTFSAEEAARSYFYLASAGLDAEASIKALPEVSKFAQAGMFDMARATDLLTDAQSALGMTIRDDAVANMENMSRISDVLVKANTLANASVEQFSTALTTKAGPAMKGVGMSVEEGVAVLAAFADQGIKAEEGGTNFAIVLRDLQTKAIDNKAAFEAAGVAVFDANGEFRNMSDIIGDLEKATAGMSDEQKKATLGMLGFSDKSMGALAALLGTSDAIARYEKELKNAGGTTDDVANKQLKSFSSQMKLLQSAVEDVFISIGEELGPALADLVPELQKLLPVIGEKLVAAIKKVDFAKIVNDLGDFVVLIVDNLDTIAKIAGGLITAAASLVTYRIATQLATTAVKIFNSELRLNPFGLVAAGLTALIIAATGYRQATEKAIEVRKKQSPLEQARTRELENLKYKQVQLNASIQNATGYMKDFYQKELDKTKGRMNALEVATTGSIGEINRLNDLKLDALVRQASKARQAFASITMTGTGGTADWLNSMFGTGPGSKTDTTNTDTTVTTGESTADRMKRIGEVIKTASKAFWAAQKDYGNAVRSANKRYNDSVDEIRKQFEKASIDAETARVTALNQIEEKHLSDRVKIQQQYADKLTKIVQDSQDRLRSVYQKAVSVDLKSMFTADTGGTVEALVGDLTAKLKASRNLLSNTAALSANGFSQTFLEQVVSAGTDTGNQLAEAILKATPETQAQLQDLFGQIEKESNTGMDALAKNIYDKAGLATDALKALYADTQAELAQALVDENSQYEKAVADTQATFDKAMAQAKITRDEAMAAAQKDLTDALAEAAQTLKDSLDQIQKDFTESMKEFGGNLGSMLATVLQFQAALDKAKAAATNIPTPTITAPVVVAPVKTPDLSQSPASPTVITTTFAAKATTQPTTVVNVNVKTDATQSNAMVGKTIAKAVTKYTSTGGALKIGYAAI